MPPISSMLVCECKYAGVVPEEASKPVIAALEAAGRRFEIVPDLCELAARGDGFLAAFAGGGAFGIAACQPRAVKALLRAAGVASRNGVGTFVNLALENSETAITTLLNVPEAPKGPSQDGQVELQDSGARLCLEGQPASPAGKGWYPWFPVIDFDRCTHCMQCLNFCLFGVFGVDEAKRLAVVSPESCKPNCPACARVCPEQAIIFPKHKAAPINGGEGGSKDIAQCVEKANLSALLGGDVYEALRARSGTRRKRFSTEPEPEGAMAERLRQIDALVASGDIPAHVIEQLREMARTR